MAADVDSRASVDDRAAFAILDCATEDCYLLCEFSSGLEHTFPDAEDADRRAMLRRPFIVLLERAEIRLHRGQQCSFPNRAGVDLEVRPDEVLQIDDDAWGMLCLCNTNQTRDAYDRAYRVIHEVTG